MIPIPAAVNTQAGNVVGIAAEVLAGVPNPTGVGVVIRRSVNIDVVAGSERTTASEKAVPLRLRARHHDGQQGEGQQTNELAHKSS